jgi:hypothetical protein
MMRGQWPALVQLPLSARLLCTAFFFSAGLGFFFSELEIYHRHHRPDKWLISISDIMSDFHGDPKRPLLVQKISPGGTMANFIAADPAGRETLLEWVKADAPREGYGRVAEVLQKRCVTCHRTGGEAGFAPFDSYENVRSIFTQHGGMSFSHILRSSHAHMWGMPFIFAFTGMVLLFSSLDERLKALIILVPFAAIVVDIGSWWATRYVSPLFALTIILGGAAYAFVFLIQFLIVMYELWVKPRPAFNAEETRRG